MALLELRGVSKRYRQGSEEVVALDGVTDAAVALVAAVWPAWRAGRVDVLDALRYE